MRIGEASLKEFFRKEEEVRRKLTELYPEKEFPNGVFSPQIGIWLRQQAEVSAESKELFDLWHECYMSQNS